MASKLVELKDAARVLGVTPEELNEMRMRGEIHGYRDGATWKFKPDEIERAAAERGIEMTGGLGSDGGSGFTTGSSDLRVRDGMSDEEFEDVLKLRDLEEASDDDIDGNSILVTEQGGPIAESSSSTIIGKSNQPSLAGESDMRMAGEDPGSGIDSDVALTPTADGSGIQLISPGSELEMSGSSGAFSGVTPTPGAVTESDILHSPDSAGKQPSAGSTGKLLVGGGAESDLILESDLSLDEDPLSSPMAGSELTLGEDIKLGESGLEDDSSSGVLAGTLGASDSGINLSKPGDSGLSLEEPLELGGSAVESSLELPEDEDSADVIALEDMGAGPGDATQLKADDEFLLTPVEEAYYDDADSGSQVIALEDSAAISDQNADTMLRASAQPALLLDPTGAPGQVDLFGGGNQAVLAQPAGAAQAAWSPTAALPEAPYSIWNVLVLMLMLGFLFVAGMLTFDLMRNMWAWDKAYGVNTSIMDAIISAVGLNN